jgi:hypothetical protein
LKIGGFQSRQGILGKLLLTLEEMVPLAKARSDKSYRDLIKQLIRSSEEAALNIEGVIIGLKGMDDAQRKSLFALANNKSPHLFSLAKNLQDFVELLNEFRALMLSLHEATTMVTRMSDAPKGRGRPRARHWEAARLLIRGWESAVPKTPFGKPITPVPKNLGAKPKPPPGLVDTKQPSTEFLVVALRMIYPNIKDSEAFTAVKEALKHRKNVLQVYEELAEASVKFGAELDWIKSPF